MVNQTYDLVVIGAGSGLNVAARAASAYGWKVAVIENGPMGGTCLNRGCIPSKIIIHAADVAETIRGADKFGISGSVNSINFKEVIERASRFVDEHAKEIEAGLMADKNIDLYKGAGEFKNAKTILVNGKEVIGERVLIAAGTRPSVPPIPGLDTVSYITSDEALRLTEQPKSMIIIGGGYISAELGHFFGALGTKISIIQQSDLLVNREDGDVSRAFTKIFSKKYEVLLNVATTKVEERGGKKIVVMQAKDGNVIEREADMLLITTGRKSNADSLKLESTGIVADKRGFIQVNEYMETSVPGVWALGDIVGKAPFKHGANWEAEHVAVNIKGEQKVAVDYSIMPHAIFTSPQIAGVGLTENQAKEQEIQYEIKKLPYMDTAMGKALEDQDGFVKFIIDPKEKKILGCHILGAEASILIHEVIVAMTSAEGKISSLTRPIYIHPALSELIPRTLLRG